MQIVSLCAWLAADDTVTLQCYITQAAIVYFFFLMEAAYLKAFH